MAYATTNPPQLISQGLGASRSLWMYVSADAEAAFDDTDYITNASALGMQTGDVALIVDTTNDLSSIAQVTLDADGNGTFTPLTAVS